MRHRQQKLPILNRKTNTSESREANRNETRMENKIDTKLNTTQQIYRKTINNTNNAILYYISIQIIAIDPVGFFLEEADIFSKLMLFWKSSLFYRVLFFIVLPCVGLPLLCFCKKLKLKLVNKSEQ